MSDNIKTLAAFLVGIGSPVIAAVMGFSSLGERLSIERMATFAIGTLVAFVTVVLWVASVEHRLRRTVGIIGAVIVTILMVAVFGASEYLHHLIVRQTHRAKMTVTTVRAALTVSAPELVFSGDRPRLAGFDTHDELTAARITVEQRSDTLIVLHAFQYPQRITVAHTSNAPVQVTAHTLNNVTLLTVAAVWFRIGIAALIGGFACAITVLLVFWCSPPPPPRSPMGFAPTAE